MSELLKICGNISRLPAAENPLSADVGVIFGERYLWLYDAGAMPERLAFLKDFGKPIHCVLSHFHPDHISALGGIEPDKIYLSRNTLKYTGRGEVVDKDVLFSDGVDIKIFPLPSSHSKGALGLQAGDYAFLGDGTYSTVKGGRTVYNQGLLHDEIKVLKGLSAKYFLLSHDPKFVYGREEVISQLEEIYAMRTKEPFIEII